jgi:hypothetical protein
MVAAVNLVEALDRCAFSGVVSSTPGQIRTASDAQYRARRVSNDGICEVPYAAKHAGSRRPSDNYAVGGEFLCYLDKYLLHFADCDMHWCGAGSLLKFVQAPPCITLFIGVELFLIAQLRQGVMVAMNGMNDQKVSTDLKGGAAREAKHSFRISGQADSADDISVLQGSRCFFGMRGRYHWAVSIIEHFRCSGTKKHWRKRAACVGRITRSNSPHWRTLQSVVPLHPTVILSDRSRAESHIQETN